MLPILCLISIPKSVLKGILEGHVFQCSNTIFLQTTSWIINRSHEGSIKAGGMNSLVHAIKIEELGIGCLLKIMLMKSLSRKWFA